MKRLFCIISALFLISSPGLASEDTDPFAFGDFDIDEQLAEEEQSDISEDSVEDAVDNTPTIDVSDSRIQPQLQTSPFIPTSVANNNNENKDNNENKKTIDSTQSLTDSFKEDGEDKKLKLPIKVEGTWVDKLATSNPLKTIKDVTSKDENKEENNSLEGMVAAASGRKINKRSNASVFDISGLMLRMKVEQVEETMQNRGFRKIYQKMEIPNFIRWRNEEKCRLDGVVGYERLDACVINRAKKDKHEYVDTMKFSKFDSQEDIEVRFTSNFTENKAYQITYKSMTPKITGNSPKATYLRNIKVYDFWKKINQKYGAPDNKDDILWGLGGNKPFMKANTGYLRLEDPMFRELDYTRMSREDQRFINSDFYNF